MAGAHVLLVTDGGVQKVVTTVVGMELVQQIAGLLGSEYLGSTKLGKDAVMWHAEDGPGQPRVGQPNVAASGLAAEYGQSQVVGPAVISGPIEYSSVFPLNDEEAASIVLRLAA